MAFVQFTLDHGKPAMVHSDRGATWSVQPRRSRHPTWTDMMIQRASDMKTKWVFCPSGCQFRNGGA